MMLSDNSGFPNHNAKHTYHTKSKTSKTITAIAPSNSVKGVMPNILHCFTKISFYKENFFLIFILVN